MNNNIKKSAKSFPELAAIQDAKTFKQIEKSQRKSWESTKPSLFGYTLCWIILSLYVGKACPFIDDNFIFASFNNLLLQVGTAIFIILAPFYVLRVIICKVIGDKVIYQWSARKYILFESVFLTLWMSLMLLISFELDILLESQLKITLGPLFLSVFALLNMHLSRQKFKIIDSTKENKSFYELKSFLSQRTKFIILISILLFLLGASVTLVSLKNFHWLIREYEEIQANFDAGILSVFKEVLFIVSILWFLIVTVIFQYSRNTRYILTLLNTSISNIFQDKFDSVYTPSSNDEFGILANNIQEIAQEMKEKHKIKNVFGKIVNPKIADLILNSSGGMQQQGEKKEVTILFTDVREFTEKASKASSPENFVTSLNKYFGEMVKIVEKHEGLIDKFIGDAIMVIHGYDDQIRGLNNAVLSALYMQDHIKRTKSTFRTGIGISSGEAIVGLVGAEERYDFTAIGEVVNMASRLECANAKFGTDIFIDEFTYNNLHQNLKKLNWEERDLDVKGYSDSVRAYSLIYDERNNNTKK